MPNKQYRGLVVAAPPHLNPKQKSDLYAFSGVEVPNGEKFACSFQSLPLPGFVMPDEFAADVAAQNPLSGDMELFAPKFDLGKFSYQRSNGDTVSARAGDAMRLTMDQLRGPAKQPALRPLPTPNVPPQQKEPTPPEPAPEPEPEPPKKSGPEMDW